MAEHFTMLCYEQNNQINETFKNENNAKGGWRTLLKFNKETYSMLPLIITFSSKLTLKSTISKNIIPINPQCFYYCILHVAGHKKEG